MSFFNIWDIILLPFYLSFFSFLAKLFKRKYVKNDTLKYYFKLAFRVKIVICIVYTLLSVLVMGGDSLYIYFFEARHFTDIIKGNFIDNLHLLFTEAGAYIQSLATDENRPALWTESNYMVIKICTILCLIGFSKLMFVNLFIAFIAFLGSWQLFMFFRNQYPSRQFEYAIACMGVPTVLFWSSAISKDAICIASIGFLAKALSDIFLSGKRLLLNLLIVGLSCYMLAVIKPYILYSLLPFLFFYIFIDFFSKLKNSIFKFSIIIFFSILYITGAYFLYVNGDDIFKQFSSEEVLGSIKASQENFTYLANTNEGSYFSLGEFDGSIGGLLRLAPSSIGTALFRPFLWESRNFLMLLSSFESLALLWLTVRNFSSLSSTKTFFKAIFTNKLVIFCLCFSLVFSMFVGISSFNFGSLVRYKIPCVPFLVCALLTIKPLRSPLKTSS